ncbi:MAG: SPOR domain-containing protein [Rhodospirillaceae bacterium]
MPMGLYDRDGVPDRGDGPSLVRRDDPKREADRGDTLRATPFTDEVFAERDPVDRSSGGRSFSLIAGVVLGLALVGGVGWYAFNGTGGTALAPGETQTIKADATPYKMKPDSPGGMQVENQDKLVYDRVAKGAAPNRVESLLPPPEEPKAPPKAPEVKPEPVKPEPAKPEAAKQAAAVAPPAAPPAKASEAPAPKTPEAPAPKTIEAIVKAANEEPAKAPPAAPTPGADPLAAAVAAATAGKAPAVEPPKVEAPKAETPVQTAALTPAPAGTLPSGSFQIQLVSVPTEEAAQSEWKRISGRHKDLFAALTPAITKADLGDKGIYYRLRAGPLADKAAADQLCASLAADKVGCIVIKP